MSQEPTDPPISPRARKRNENELLQSTESFVEVLPDPSSPRARRISERQERLADTEVEQLVTPKTESAVDAGANQNTEQPVKKRRGRKKKIQTTEQPTTSSAPAPKRRKGMRNNVVRGLLVHSEKQESEERARGRKPRETNDDEEEEEEEDAPTTSEHVLPRAGKKTLRSGIVPIQIVFGDDNKKPSKRDQEENLAMLKELYPEIRKEYDEAVDAEVSEDYLQQTKCNRGRNKFRNIVMSKFSSTERARIRRLPEDRVTRSVKLTFVKPEVNARGDPMKKVKVHCSRVEVGDTRPGMTYWVPIEQSITTKDRHRLTHLPYFEDGQDDDEINEQMFEVFPEGIHGHGDNWEYINDWILYKMMRKVLEEGHETESPDMIYYNLYRLWSNKLTQTELSEEFPKLCERFAESDYDVSAAEPWKSKPVQEVGRNLIGKIECYGCLSNMCAVHGFVKDIAPYFPGGEYYEVSIPLPCPSNDQYCSDNCWKMVQLEDAVNILQPTEDELERGCVKAYINKWTQAKNDAEIGLLMSAYGLSTTPFCEFAAMNVDCDDEDLRIRTCRAAYELVIAEVERPSEARLRMTRPGKAYDFQKRTQRFRRYQQNKEREKHREQFDKNKKEDIRMEMISPLAGCRHNGPCDTAEDCSCRSNGVCSYLCQCEINCKQRFPGCNCAPGLCHTKACQCFRVRWECHPLTCRTCKCGEQDSQYMGCANCSMTRLVSKKLAVAPSRIAGNGLFLLEGAEKDEFITEYVGERITDDEAERRGAIYDRYQTSYIFNLETGGAIDSNNVGNLSRFANHDEKNPTCYARTMVVAGEHRIGFCAKYKLEPNTELTFDYSYSGEHQKVFKHGTRAYRRKKATQAENV